jgi:ankyrin repeat protein
MNTGLIGATLLVLCVAFSACSGDDIWEQERLNQALIKAVSQEDLSRVDSCLRAGASLEIRTMEGATPLILAAERGNQPILERLIDAGAQPDAKRLGYYASTALMEAAVKNDTLTAAMLLRSGADIRLRDTFGDPAINWGAYYGHRAYVALLLDNGADWNTESKHGNALDIATKEWNLEVCRLFIGRGAGQKLPAPAEALVRAVWDDDINACYRLLGEGVSPDQKDELGMPLLIWAAALGYDSLLNVLLEDGADVNATNRTGQSALAAAARFGHMDILQALLEKKADPNLAGSRYRLTPLMAATIGGHVDIAERLLANGADINTQDALVGYSALMYAVAYGYPELVGLFIEKRANPYLKGTDGTGLYDLMGYARDESIAKMLEAYVLARQ